MLYKITYLLLFTLSLSFLSFTQELEDFDIFYVLDEYKSPNGRTYIIGDDSPNYFQISEGKVMLTGRDRGKSFLHTGPVEEFSVSMNEHGDQVLTFYAMNTFFSSGRILSFEVVRHKNQTVTIHHFNKLNNKDANHDAKYDKYYFGHVASESEVQEIKDYWDSQRRKKEEDHPN